MIKSIKRSMLVLSSILTIVLPLAVPVAVNAQIKDSLTQGICATDPNGCTSSTDPNGTINGIVKTVIDIFSLVVGIVAVVMIIVGGLKYITSGGDSGNVSGAKNTILYAVIGLVVVALAQFIVRFVLNKATNATASQ